MYNACVLYAFHSYKDGGKWKKSPKVFYVKPLLMNKHTMIYVEILRIRLFTMLDGTLFANIVVYRLQNL